MNMFKQKPRIETPLGQPVGNTLIGNGTSINGDIIAAGDLRIDGTLIGQINGVAKVVIGATGVVVGDISCVHADIQGKVTGNLNISDLLNLRGEAVIEGDIRAGKLYIETNVSFNGHCHMGKDEKVVEMTKDEKRRAIDSR
ncbi:MAG: polymer-forming cytoskeletal protein [Bacteroidetes bacterium]|nr:polymer-forming cytoskeletal protein [Bacteroidota bacterium]